MAWTFCGDCGASMDGRADACPCCGAVVDDAPSPRRHVYRPSAISLLDFANDAHPADQRQGAHAGEAPPARVLPSRQFTANTGAAAITICGLLVISLVSLLFIDALATERQIIARASDAENLSVLELGEWLQDAQQSDEHKQRLFGVWALASVVTGVSFLFWFHRSARNLQALNVRGLRFAPSSAVWGFIIPVLNLFRPYFVTREIWRASSPEGVDSQNTGSEWENQPVPGLLNAWWLGWAFVAQILNVPLYIFQPKMDDSLQFIDDLRTYDVLLMAYFLFYAVLAGIATTIVYRVTRRQCEAARLLESRSFIARAHAFERTVGLVAR